MTKPSSSGGGTLTASSHGTRSNSAIKLESLSPGGGVGSVGEGGSNSNTATRVVTSTRTRSKNMASHQASHSAVATTTSSATTAMMPTISAATLPLQEACQSTSLTPALEQSKISEDTNFESSLDDELSMEIMGDNDDVTMNDIAQAAQSGNENSVSVKIMEGEALADDNAMEVEPEIVDPLPENIMEGYTSFDQAVMAPPPANQQQQPPPPYALPFNEGEAVAGRGVDDVVINGIAIHKSESDMAATANKLTGVSTTHAPAEDMAAASNNNHDNDGSNNETSNTNSPSFSMTLAIGPEDTQRVFCASKAFNTEIQKLQRSDADEAAAAAKKGAFEQKTPAVKKEDTKNRMPAIVHSPPSREEPLLQPPPSANEKDVNFQTPHPPSNPPPPPTGPRPLRDLLLPAAKNTNDPLITSFLGQMDYQKKEKEEIQTSLIFFLDADKSTKLLAAFDVHGSFGEEDPSRGVPSEDSRDDSAAKLVQRAGLIQMFQSFLTSISTCVHGEEKQRGVEGEGGNSRASTPTVQNYTSPTIAMKDNSKQGNGSGGNGDWKGSDKTLKEILEVATFAANNLSEFAKKENSNDAGEEKQPAEGETGVSFDIFGEWYNSGGFSLVPWLELLDLSKWDYAGNDNNTNSSSGASASKRARIHSNDKEPFTPGYNMNEPIGSPTALFASGALLGETPLPESTHSGMDAASFAFEPPGGGRQGGGGVRSFSAMFGEMDESRTVVSFDFSGSSPNNNNNNPNNNNNNNESSFHIDITEENLIMLRNLVRRTGFAQLSPQHVESLMMKHARIERHKYGETMYVISRIGFGKFIREVVPKDSSKRFDPAEVENFSNYFTNFFTCFDYSWSELKKDEVNAKELMVGFSFLFAGIKSSKLAAAYDMLDVDNHGYLTQRGLMQYLRSYLTMLAGISLLSANKKTTTQIRKRLLSPNQRDDAFLAVENGAKWTLSHFLRAFEKEHARQPKNSTRSNAVTFEDFAKWYTKGGYAVAPWLELLDLQKFLSLIGEEAGKIPAEAESLAEVLFTFPLAKGRSLVVLRDDAHYVRSVVNELGLLSLTSEDIWSVLFNDVAKSVQAGTAGGGDRKSNRKSIRMEVDQSTFVQCMMRILSGTGKIKQHSSSEWTEFSPEDTLKNFYLSFDLAQSKQVALNQLMCGLTLLCGGKKSNKLVFAFGLFGGDDSGKNSKKKASMTNNDFFHFFRSFLIVMFSCCNQSLSLSADAVTQYISDTAKEVANDVMAYWKAKKVDKVKFENFSEWYNEGGYETAPWLELLDLKKWVLADQTPAQQQQAQQQQTQPQQQQTQPQHQQETIQLPMTPAHAKSSGVSCFTPGLTPGHEAIKALLASPKIQANGSSPNCPPAPPDDDPLFDLDMSAVDAEVDEMDFILQHESAAASQSHAENVNYLDPAATTAAGSGAQTPSKAAPSELQNALQFNLLTHDQFIGYKISIGPNQVQLLHRIVTETGLWQIDAPIICKFILYDAKSRRQTNLTKKAFQSAMKRVFEYAFQSLPGPVSQSTQEELSAFTEKLFTSFDRPPSKTGKVNAVELACGFTVLCGGRKSDKLEHVFELLDEDKDSLVSREDISRFIQSFLVMLMSVSSSFTHLYGGPCSNDSAAISRAIDAGSEWATSQVFDALQTIPTTNKNGGTTHNICFDDFADWYTKGGYQSMPWLELLDLRKWVLGES